MKLNLPLRREGTVDVLAVGENSVDLVAVVDGHPRANAKIAMAEFQELAGGEAASAAVGLTRLGWRSKYIGRFGSDRLGDLVRHQLSVEGVDISDSTVVPDTRNRLAVILVNRQNGERTVVSYRAPRLALLPGDIPAAAISAARVLLVGSDDAEAMTSAAARARAHGVRTVGDMEHVHAETPALLHQLDVVIAAATFPEALTGKRDPGAALRALAAMSKAPLVCVTLGEEGCLAVAEGKEVRVPAFPIEAIDTTGAGDLFRAGLIARWLATPVDPEVVELLRYANAVAALNCRAVGAQTAAPRRDEVEALLRS